MIRTGMILAAAVLGMTVTVSAEENLFLKVNEANRNEALLKNSDKVAFRENIYDAEGNVYSSYCYGDQERIVCENNGSVSIQEAGGIYGFDSEKQVMFTTLFLDDAADYEYFSIADCRIDDSENLIECYSEGSSTYMITEIVGDEEVAFYYQLLENLGYDMNRECRIQATYVVDTESCELQSGCSTVFCDEEENVFLEMERVADPEEYVVSEEISAALNSDDTRVVTVICDPDTENETSVSKTVPIGVSVKVQPSWEHPNLYSDRACTQFLQDGDDFQTDMTVYSKKE